MNRQAQLNPDNEITSAGHNKVPGTELLYDTGKGGTRVARLQYIRDSDGNHVLLVPQPSLTDPNDPLRWSVVKKWGTFFNGVAYAFMGSVTGPIMAAGMIELSTRFNKSLQKITYANGATLICQGFGNILWMPLAIKYGRRPVYLLSNILMGVACVWLGAASDASYTPLIIGRAFLGLFEAPIESIVPTTITDIYFLHNRGAKVSFYGLSVLGGNELGPVFSALIIQHLGMGWAFYIVAMFIFLSCVFMFLFMPETRYLGERPATYLVNSEEEIREKDIPEVRRVEDAAVPSTSLAGKELAIEDGAASAPPKRSFFKELSPWSGSDPNTSFRKAFLRPFVLASYPTVLWASLVYGVALAWNVIIGATVAQLFGPDVPEYGFDSQAQGLVFLSPLIGSLIGTWLCGPLSDLVANKLTKRNDGIREPEMRLPVCIVTATLTFLGALMAGLTYNHKTHWAGPIVGLGVLSAGAQTGVSLSMSYALDCHKELSVELMVTVASLKSLLAWIFTWVINDWIISDGMLTVFMVIATINVVIHLTTIGLYLYGKRIRIWIAERDLLERYGLK